MAAKIIQFPGTAPAPASAAPRRDEGAPFELAIEIVDTDPARLHRASVGAGGTLADLHRAITRLFRWDETHNYFFSHGSCRYEDPALFRAQDRLTARCRKIYSAADVPVSAVLRPDGPPLFYVYNLANCWELRISLADDVPLKQFG